MPQLRPGALDKGLGFRGLKQGFRVQVSGLELRKDGFGCPYRNPQWPFNGALMVLNSQYLEYIRG